MTVALVIFVTAFALVVGAFWGTFLRLPVKLEGFLIAMAGGALIVTVMEELIRPAAEVQPLWSAMFGVAIGAAVFTGADYLVDDKLYLPGNFGLLLAVTLDGVPENLALGTALIGSGALEVAALAGAILLSNLPEAAGGSKRMVEDGMERKTALFLWTATAGLLAGTALLGYFALSDVPPAPLGFIKCFAAGAVVASLAIEVFPKAFNEDHKLSGLAVAVGLILAYLLNQLA